MLDNFELLKTRFTLEADEDILLPAYKGSALRGGLGHLLKAVCCDQPEKTGCKECAKKEGCVYSYLYETQLPKGSDFIKSFNDIPRPFVIEPPLSEKRKFFSGDRFDFDLILFGRAINFFPYFLVLYKSFGEDLGIGFGRGKFSVARITSVDLFDEDWQILYTPHKDFSAESLSQSIISFADILERDADRRQLDDELTIEFLTPLDVRTEGKLVHHVSFPIFFKTLLRTISNLSYFHCNEPLDIDFKGLIESAEEKVRTKSDDTRVGQLARYSSRQRGTIPIRGHVGRITYKGAFEEFSDLLALGEWTHVGKGRVIGLGKYQRSS